MSNLRILQDTPTILSQKEEEERWCVVAEKKEEESKIVFEKEESQKRNVHLSQRKRYPLSSLPVKKRYREDFDNHNGASTLSSTINLPCFETEKKKDPPNLTAIESSSPFSSTSDKRLYVKQRKSADGFNKAKVDPLPIKKRKTMMKDPPSSNDVEYSSPSSFTSSKRLNVEQKKRRDVSRKQKTSPNPSVEQKKRRGVSRKPKTSPNPSVEQKKRRGVSRKPKTSSNPSVERQVPEWVYQMMRNINSDFKIPELIFETTLSVSDVSSTQSRLLIPFNTLINKEFLTPDEERAMNTEESNNNVGVETILVNERSQKWKLRFKKKNCGKQTFYYVLNSAWNNVVKSNNLKANDKIGLWTFRNNNGVLCFALELLV